jgi:hypothetical protein
LPAASLAIGLGDKLFAVAAAVIIFPALFSFGMNPVQGAALVFIVLPKIFSRMNGGLVVGIAFFGLLVVAALTSLIALIENLPRRSADPGCRGLCRLRYPLAAERACSGAVPRLALARGRRDACGRAPLASAVAGLALPCALRRTADDRIVLLRAPSPA